MNIAIIFIILISVYYICLPAAAGVGYSRFRHPVMPLMCILGGYGLYITRAWMDSMKYNLSNPKILDS